MAERSSPKYGPKGGAGERGSGAEHQSESTRGAGYFAEVRATAE